MVRTSRSIRHALAWGAFGILLATAFALLTYPNVPPGSDVWDYSQEARQLARGEGFTSLYTYPVHLGVDQPPFPIRWRMPLYAIAGAGLLKVGISLPAGFFALGVVAPSRLVALVFLLGAELHSARAGAIAAAAALASPLLLDPYSAALSQESAAALGLGVWLLLLRGTGILSAVPATLIAAAAWYLRAESALFIPLWLWVAAGRGRGRPAVREASPGRAAVFALSYAALSLPWIVASRSLSGGGPIQGNPMLLYTPEYPGYSSSRMYGEALPGVLSYVGRHLLAFAARFAKDALGYGVDLLWGLGPLAVGLAMAGLLLRLPKERWGSLRPAAPLLVGVALQIAAFSCMERSPRFLVPAVPLACVAIGMAAAPSIDRICGRRNVVALFLLVILERSLTVALEAREAARRFPPLPTTLAGEIEGVLATADTARAETTRAGGRPLIWTDVPDWVAWHLDRPALLLPLWKQQDRVALDHPASAIILSPDSPGRNAADGEGDWNRVYEQLEPIDGFAGPRVLPGGTRVYVLESGSTSRAYR
jgi:hypothetical protein